MQVPMNGQAGAPVLTGLKLADGVFSASLSADGDRPQIDLTIAGRVVGTATLDRSPDGLWRLAARLPRQCLCDGDVAVVFQDRASGAGLATYLVSSGYPAVGDALAEIAALRAEFEALKRAFLTEAWHEKLRRADRPLIVAEVLDAVERRLVEARPAGQGPDAAGLPGEDPDPKA